MFTFQGEFTVLRLARLHTCAAECTCGCRLYASEYTTPDGERRYYSSTPDLPYFQASRKVAWSRQLLLQQSALLERSQVAFDGFATAYSGWLHAAALPGANVHVGDLRAFDYRLAESAWMQHELLVAQRDAGLPYSTVMELRGGALQHNTESSEQVAAPDDEGRLQLRHPAHDGAAQRARRERGGRRGCAAQAVRRRRAGLRPCGMRRCWRRVQ